MTSKIARYASLNREGYYCPNCMRPISIDRQLSVYFCPRITDCGYRASRDEYAEQLRENLTVSHMRKAVFDRRNSTDAVYYIKFRDVIKIGTSQNAMARIADLPCEEILGLEPGGIKIERERHRQFAETRVLKEWFLDEPGLRAHIAEMNTERREWAMRVYGAEFGAAA